MVKFGICMPLADREAVAAARDAGWDYVEDSAANLLQGANADDSTWNGPQMVHASPLPNLACNELMPEHLKIAGLHANPFAVHDYLEVALRRAEAIGVQTLVFGSGVARTVPDDVERSLGLRQVIDFLEVLGGLAGRHGVTVALKHLHRGETNVMNSLAECAAVARVINRPNIRVAADTFHLWTEQEPLEHVRDAMDVLAHVHLADRSGRVAPGESGDPQVGADYRAVFQTLKRGGYCGKISVEALDLAPPVYGRVLEFVRTQWRQA